MAQLRGEGRDQPPFIRCIRIVPAAGKEGVFLGKKVRETGSRQEGCESKTKPQGVNLGRDGIGGLMLKLALPAIAAQVINALYNIVDRIYIGQLPGAEGTNSLAALGVCFPLVMIISAFGTLVGIGGSSLAAIRMGEGKHETAERILSNCLPLLVIFTAVLMPVCLLFGRELLFLVGATENTVEYALPYFNIYVLGTLPVLVALGLNSFINTQGFATVSMLTVLIGAVSNILLDPILIYVFDMGVHGAAIATVASQTISAVWVLCFLTGKKTKLHLRVAYMRPRWSLLGPVIALGLSPFIMNSTESLVGIVINITLTDVSPDAATADLYIGAYAIMSSVMQMVMMPLTGLSQGAQPIISYNYGAARFDRVKKAYRLFLLSAVVFTGVVWAAVMLFPQIFIRLFSSDATLAAVAVKFIRVYLLLIVLMGVQIACQQTFVATGHAKVSLFLALLRKVILLIPLILLFSRFWAEMGVFIAEPVADTLAVSITVLLFYLSRKSVFGNPKRGTEPGRQD